MEVSGYFQGLATLPPVPIAEDVGCGGEENKIPAPARNQTPVFQSIA
jgi:hypothetical protein